MFSNDHHQQRAAAKSGQQWMQKRESSKAKEDFPETSDLSWVGKWFSPGLAFLVEITWDRDPGLPR